MKISARDWERYIQKLAKIDETAANRMQSWLAKGGTKSVDEMVEYGYALTAKYGEAAASLACEMYDALAAAQGFFVPPAEPAETATYGETAKAVRGTLNNRLNTVPDTVGRLVKQAGADTTLKNAARDGAQFAWIPHGGETCAFCIMLASRGWQRMSEKAVKGSHAEHIHAHCKCEYAVRFGKNGGVAGYDPDRYLRMYENADGATWQDKVNAMRREQYAENKDAINAQKRAAYAARNEINSAAAEQFGPSVDTERQRRIEERKAAWKEKRAAELAQFDNIQPTNERGRTEKPKTIEQAEKIGKRYSYTGEFSIHPKMKLEVVNGFNEAAERVMERYGRKLRIRGLSPVSSGNMRYMNAAYDPNTGVVHLKNKSLAAYAKESEKKFAEGWLASKDPYGTFFHELGHVVWEDLPREVKDKVKAIYNDEKHAAFLKWKEKGGSRSKMSQADVFQMSLSRYGHTNVEEFFGEAFAQIMSGRARPVSRKVRAVLESEYQAR